MRLIGSAAGHGLDHPYQHQICQDHPEYKELGNKHNTCVTCNSAYSVRTPVLAITSSTDSPRMVYKAVFSQPIAFMHPRMCSSGVVASRKTCDGCEHCEINVLMLIEKHT